MSGSSLQQSIKQVLDALDGHRTAPLTAQDQALLDELAARLAAPAAPTKHDSATLRRRERIAQMRFDYALSGIIETDSQQRILNANPAASSITGRSLKALLAMPVHALFAPDRREQVDDYFALLQEQGITQSELQLEVPGGETLNIQIASIQADDDLFMHVFDDVSEDRRKSRELLEARQAAESASRAKSEFLANVSHEIRTPLNGILGLTHLLLMTDLSAQQQDYLNKIFQSSNTLLQMLNDLLDVAKIESGKLEFEQETIDLHEVYDELATIAAHSAASKDLELVFAIDAQTPQFMRADRLRLTQILTNLLGNAVKFTAHGHVALSVSVPPDSDNTSQIRFAVSDTGQGITPDVMERLFKPFAQADAATTRRYGGTGLGLVISQQLALKMGGDLSVRSVPGEGSTFTLDLPLTAPLHAVAALDISSLFEQAGPVSVESDHALTQRALCELVVMSGGTLSSDAKNHLRIHDLIETGLSPQALLQRFTGPAILLANAAECSRLTPLLSERADIDLLTRPLTPRSLARAMRKVLGLQAQNPTATDMGIPAEFRGATVAVAEDMLINQQVIVGLLEKAGVKVRLADNGQALLALLAAEPTPSELIFMDIHMPVMDGIEATKKLRAQGYSRPIIALSASAISEERARCISAGMNDFLPKPIDLDELWGVLTRWLKPREPSQPVATVSLGVSTTDVAPLLAAGIAVDDALPRFLGDVPALWRAITAFLLQHRDDAQALRQLLHAGKREDLAKLAHGLKGTAGMMGAKTLEQLGRTLEHLPPDMSLQEIEDLITQVGDIIQTIDAALHVHQLASRT